MSKPKRSRPQEKLLHEFMEREALAPWVRALSDHQVNLLFQLRPALRDDIEQGTCYRVRRIIVNIGIKPIMDSRLLRKMIELSRGNDLAFLYFILEGFYKTDGNRDGDYSLNEKYIMSAISQLDMPFTLTALDVILPPAPQRQPKVEQQAKARKAPKDFNTRTSTFESRREMASSLQKQKKLPYFQKLQRPKRISVRLHCEMPNYHVKKSFFSEFAMRAIDSDRWFAKYELQPSLRVVKRTIDEAVNQLLDDDDDGSKPKASLCMYHRFWAEEAKNVKDALKVAAKERCLSIIDTEAHRNRTRLARILKQLADDIDWHAAKYKSFAKLQLTKMQMIYKNCHVDCELCRRLVSTLALPHDMRVMYGETDVERHATVATNNVITLSGPNEVMKNVQDNVVDEETAQKPFHRPKGSKSQCLNGKVQNTKRVDGQRLNNKQKTKRKPQKKLFKAPTSSKPHNFDYMHIFPTKTKQLSNVKIIEDACVAALHRKPSSYDSDDSERGSNCRRERRETCQTYRPGEKVKPEPSAIAPYSPTDWSISSEDADAVAINDDLYTGKKAKIMNEVVECAKRIVTKKLAQRNSVDLKKHMELQTRLAEEDRNNVHQLPKLKYEKIEHFDPDNDELMGRMLQDAMNILKKDRRFIVAAFPEAYKLRNLREWIKQRYGKTYSRDDMDKSFRQSFAIFRAVMSLQRKTPPVDMLGMKNTEVDYNEYEKIMKQSKMITKRYHNLVNDDLMDQTAFCWFAMGGHLWARGSPKDLFYAYLPANDGDINRVHPWR